MDFDKDRRLSRTFCNPFEASYEDAEPTSQLELIDLHVHIGDEWRSKFREGDLRNFCVLLFV
jgi:hypothetical protein